MDVSWYLSRAYDIPVINQQLHYIHIMAYDYHRPENFRQIHFPFIYIEQAIVNSLGWGHFIFCFIIETTGHNNSLRMPVNSSMVQPENVVSAHSLSGINCIIFKIFPLDYQLNFLSSLRGGKYLLAKYSFNVEGHIKIFIEIGSITRKIGNRRCFLRNKIYFCGYKFARKQFCIRCWN